MSSNIPREDQQDAQRWAEEDAEKQQAARTDLHTKRANATLRALAALKSAHRQLCEQFLGYPVGVHQRLARAMELLTTDTQYTIATWESLEDVDRLVYHVLKQERGKESVCYVVDLEKEPSCTCPDQISVRICKHALAVRLLIMCAQ